MRARDHVQHLRPPRPKGPLSELQRAVPLFEDDDDDEPDEDDEEEDDDENDDEDEEVADAGDD